MLQTVFRLAMLAVVVLAQGTILTQAQGATFYVSTTGADANPGSEALPWRTVQKAASTLTAGQTALLRGGTYVESLIQFTNSGSAGNPITIKNYPGETPLIDGGFTSSSGQREVFRIDGRHFITLDGLSIRRGRAGLVFISQNADATNISVQNCTLTDFLTFDNSAAVYVGTGADDIVIRNNVIHTRIQGGEYNHIGSGVIVFNARDITIENNEISDLVNGIYYKHSTSLPQSTVVQKNRIHHLSHDGIQWNRRDAMIRDNVIYNVGQVGIRVFDEAASCDRLVTSGNQILHNTLVDAAIGVYLNRSSACPGAVGTIVRDNLISHFTDGGHRGVSIFAYQSSDSSNTTLQKNLVYGVSQPSPVRVLSSYYAVTALPASVTASGNISAVPVFHNYAARSFSLLPGPGKGAASDGLDMGALVCSAGVNASCTLPAKPTNLRLTTPPS